MKHKSEDFKIAAVRHFRETSHSRKDTSRVLRCSPRSLNRWIDEYDKTGHILRHNRPSVAYKVTDTHVGFAKKYVCDHHTVSMRELHAITIGRFPGLIITPQHIGTVLRAQNFTRKRTRHGMP
jgi:transposase